MSLELCPETFALTGALRLHAHLALVFTNLEGAGPRLGWCRSSKLLSPSPQRRRRARPELCSTAL